MTCRMECIIRPGRNIYNLIMRIQKEAVLVEEYDFNSLDILLNNDDKKIFI